MDALPVVVFLSFLLLAPLIGVAIGRWLARRRPHARGSIVAAALLALAAAVLSVWPSTLYPGPRTYPAWSLASAARASALFLLTIPIWTSLAAFHLQPARIVHRGVWAALAGYLSIAPELLLVIVAGCSQAGACF